MVFGGGKAKREAEAHAAAAKKEVEFWKQQLDHAVDEKKSLLERYTRLYRHAYDLENVMGSLESENKQLRQVFERKNGLGPAAAAGALGSPIKLSGSNTVTPDGRSTQQALSQMNAALKQADVQIAILEEHIASLKQENELLVKQNDLLRSSEAAYQKEAMLLREELSNARGINDFTADETTKLLLDNSRLHQGFLAARSEVLHKDEMLRLLSAEVNELSAKLEMYASSGNIGLEASWETLPVERSSTTVIEPAVPAMASDAVHLETADSACPEQQQAAATSGGAAAAVSGLASQHGSASIVSGSSEAAAAAEGSTEAAVEALAAAMPLKMGPGLLRNSQAERRGTFSGQPITPQDMAELKEKMGREGLGLPLQLAHKARCQQQLSHAMRQWQPQQDITYLVQQSSAAEAPAAEAPAAAEQAAAGAGFKAAFGVANRLPLLAEVPTAVADQEEEEVLQGSPTLPHPEALPTIDPALPVADTAAVGPPAAASAGASAGAGSISQQLPEAEEQRATPGSAAPNSLAVPNTLVVQTTGLGGTGLSHTQQEEVSVEDDETWLSSKVSADPTAASTMGLCSQDMLSPATAALAAAAGANGMLVAARSEQAQECSLASTPAASNEANAAAAAAAGVGLQLSELTPGKPQRQQALARLAAEQQHSSAVKAAPRTSSAAAAAAAAGLESAAKRPSPQLVSPRSNLAAAMLDAAAVVEAAAAAGVLDASDDTASGSDAAPAVSAAVAPAADGTAASVVGYWGSAGGTTGDLAPGSPALAPATQRLAGAPHVQPAVLPVIVDSTAGTASAAAALPSTGSLRARIAALQGSSSGTSSADSSPKATSTPPAAPRGGVVSRFLQQKEQHQPQQQQQPSGSPTKAAAGRSKIPALPEAQSLKDRAASVPSKIPHLQGPAAAVAAQTDISSDASRENGWPSSGNGGAAQSKASGSQGAKKKVVASTGNLNAKSACDVEDRRQSKDTGCIGAEGRPVSQGNGEPMLEAADGVAGGTKPALAQMSRRDDTPDNTDGADGADTAGEGKVLQPPKRQLSNRMAAMRAAFEGS